MNNKYNNLYEEVTKMVIAYQTSSSGREKHSLKTSLVLKMTPIVKRIAHAIARRSYDPIEDMVQAGFIGLLKAIDRFNINKNDNFRVYACHLIVGEMKHYLRDQLLSIKVPAYVQELCIRINNFIDNLTNDQILELTDEKLAKALKISKKTVEFLKVVEKRKNVLSFEEVHRVDDIHKLSAENYIAYEDEEERLKTKEYKIIFNNIVDKLPDEEKIVIEMHYRQHMTQKEIAEALDLSKMSITRRMKSAYDNISNLIIKNEKEEYLKSLLNIEE